MPNMPEVSLSEAIALGALALEWLGEDAAERNHRNELFRAAQVLKEVIAEARPLKIIKSSTVYWHESPGAFKFGSNPPHLRRRSARDSRPPGRPPPK